MDIARTSFCKLFLKLQVVFLEPDVNIFRQEVGRLRYTLTLAVLVSDCVGDTMPAN